MPKKAVLTKVQEYYILGNMEVLKPDQIATDLGVSAQLVRDFIAARKQAATKPAENLYGSLLQKEKGAVAMTEAASQYGDELSSGGFITQADVNRASAAGDYRRAAELAEKRETQQKASQQDIRERNADRWFFIR